MGEAKVSAAHARIAALELAAQGTCPLEVALPRGIVGADARRTRCNRRIIVPRYGGPDVMTVVEEPLPEPGPGEVQRIEPLVAARIPLVEARRAHENLGRGRITGKQILICDEKALGIADWVSSAP